MNHQELAAFLVSVLAGIGPQWLGNVLWKIRLMLYMKLYVKSIELKFLWNSDFCKIDVLFIYYKTLNAKISIGCVLTQTLEYKKKGVVEISLLVLHVQGHVQGRN